MVDLDKSLVIGVHDGLTYLPFTLRNYAQLPVDEKIFVLDHCRPFSLYEKTIRHFVPDAKIIRKERNETKYRPCETFSLGLSKAQGNILYVSAEDVILDPKNFDEKYWVDSTVGMVDFRYYQCDPFKFNFHVAWDTLLTKVSDKLGYGSVRSGLYGIRRDLLDKIGGLKDSPTEEDWLRKDVVQLGYSHVHIKTTRNLHLRPSYDKTRQLM